MFDSQRKHISLSVTMFAHIFDVFRLIRILILYTYTYLSLSPNVWLSRSEYIFSKQIFSNPQLISVAQQQLNPAWRRVIAGAEGAGQQMLITTGY